MMEKLHKRRAKMVEDLNRDACHKKNSWFGSLDHRSLSFYFLIKSKA